MSVTMSMRPWVSFSIESAKSARVHTRMVGL